MYSSLSANSMLRALPTSRAGQIGIAVILGIAVALTAGGVLSGQSALADSNPGRIVSGPTSELRLEGLQLPTLGFED